MARRVVVDAEPLPAIELEDDGSPVVVPARLPTVGDRVMEAVERGGNARRYLVDAETDEAARLIVRLLSIYEGRRFSSVRVTA